MIEQRKNQTCLSPNGLRIGFAEYGDPSGSPLFYLHGTPGSRIIGTDDDPIAHAAGIRLITIDRPGYGLSDPAPGRTIAQVAEDVRAVADHLGLKQFAVAGVSGGGVFALAVASALPERVVRAGLIASAFPFANRRPPRTMCRPNRIAFLLARRAPWLLHLAFHQQKKLVDSKPERYIRSAQKHVGHLCAWDQQILQQPETARAICAHMQEAFRQGVRAPVEELRLLSSDWREITLDQRVPVTVWHGTADTLSPVEGMRSFATKLTECTTHYLEGKGHFLDADTTIWADILQELGMPG